MRPLPEPRSQRAVPALHRGLDILEALLDQPQWSAPDLGRRLGLPRSTVHDLVSALVVRGYLVPCDGHPVRFRLGARLAQLGAAFGGQLDLVREATPLVERVAATCEETVNLAILDGAHVIYLVKVDSIHPIRMVSAVGRRLPAHCTSLGKAMLAELPVEHLRTLYPERAPLEAMTPFSITTVAALRARLAEVRRTGIAYDDRESDEGMWCVGAPVRDHTGDVIAGLSISTPMMRRTPATDTEWVRLVREGAAELSARLGHPAA